jgi:hypothetical protein
VLHEKHLATDVKGKGTPNRPVGPGGGGRGIALLFLDLCTRRGGWSALRPGRFIRGTDPARIVQEARWGTGPVWTGAENLAPTGIRSPDRPARYRSLYGLSYPGATKIILKKIILLVTATKISVQRCHYFSLSLIKSKHNFRNNWHYLRKNSWYSHYVQLFTQHFCGQSDKISLWFIWDVQVFWFFSWLRRKCAKSKFIVWITAHACKSMCFVASYYVAYLGVWTVFTSSSVIKGAVYIYLFIYSFVHSFTRNFRLRFGKKPYQTYWKVCILRSMSNLSLIHNGSTGVVLLMTTRWAKHSKQCVWTIAYSGVIILNSCPRMRHQAWWISEHTSVDKHIYRITSALNIGRNRTWLSSRTPIKCKILNYVYYDVTNASTESRAGLWVGRAGHLPRALTSRGRRKGSHRPATR